MFASQFFFVLNHTAFWAYFQVVFFEDSSPLYGLLIGIKVIFLSCCLLLLLCIHALLNKYHVAMPYFNYTCSSETLQLFRILIFTWLLFWDQALLTLLSKTLSFFTLGGRLITAFDFTMGSPPPPHLPLSCPSPMANGHQIKGWQSYSLTREGV